MNRQPSIRRRIAGQTEGGTMKSRSSQQQHGIPVRVAWLAALLALALVTAGTGYAAQKYVITSTKQISPKVLTALKGDKGPAGGKGDQGPKGSQGSQGPACAYAPAGVYGSAGAQGPAGAAG